MRQLFLSVLFATLEMLRGVVQPREANSSRSGNIRSTGQKDRRRKKKQEQEKDVDDDDDQEISCGSGVPSSAHGAHTGRDGDGVLLQLEVGVGGMCGGERGEEATRKYNET
jgi:hypothetical protein